VNVPADAGDKSTIHCCTSGKPFRLHEMIADRGVVTATELLIFGTACPVTRTFQPSVRSVASFNLDLTADEVLFDPVGGIVLATSRTSIHCFLRVSTNRTTIVDDTISPMLPDD